MHITNFVLKAFFSVAVLSLTTLSLAHEGHHSTAQTDGKNVPSMNHQAMSRWIIHSILHKSMHNTCR